MDDVLPPLTDDEMRDLTKQALARWHKREHCMATDPAEAALVYTRLNRPTPVGVVRELVAEVYWYRASAQQLKIIAGKG